MSQHSARLPYHQLSSKAFMGLVNVSETIKREAPFFSERERAAFRWAVIITATPHSDASDDEYAKLKALFSDAEISDLGFAIAVINAWNLLNAGMRAPIPQAG